MADLLSKFKQFQSSSKGKYSELYNRISQERDFLSGKQWSKEDDKFIAKSRNRVMVNVLSNQINSVSNQYAAFPFTWYTGEASIDQEIDRFFGTDSNRFAVDEALRDCVGHGLGILALGSDTDSSGNEVPVIYSVSDFDRVLLDGDITELDGSDAMEGALIDYRSREWIRVHMGEEFVPGKREKMMVTAASCATLVPIVTYYFLETDGCHMVTFVNERQNGDAQVLPIHRIPIFPVFGEMCWVDGKKSYRGLVDKGMPIQKIVNYSMTQLCERLALSPKPQWKGYLESFKDLDTYYKSAGTGENPIVPAQRLANDKTTVLPLPERCDNSVQYSDVRGIVEGSLGMLSSITGVDSRGLADATSDITATAVNYTAKVFQNNVRHYFSHLRTSFKALGDCVMVLMKHPEYTVEVAQGPENFMEMQVARAELTALMGVVEPNQKRALVNAILKTHPDNDVLAQLFADLNAIPAPTPMEEQAIATAQQMKVAIDQKDKEILQLTSRVEQMQRQLESMDKSYLFDLKKMELEHRYKQEDAILDAQLSQGADAEKAAAETAKAELSAEKEAISLEKEKVKASSEMARSIDAMFGGF